MVLKVIKLKYHIIKLLHKFKNKFNSISIKFKSDFVPNSKKNTENWMTIQRDQPLTKQIIVKYYS